MPSHWTYEDYPPDSDLQQGDILAPTDEIRKLFREVHPHFSDEKYLAFMVITQSCDLARRQEEATARYINVAAVRSLSATLPILLDTVCQSLKPGVYSEKDKNRAAQLLERIFNQNEQRLGLFYLFPDGEVGLGEDAIAFLRVSVAFRVEHYEIMQRSRSGRLKPEFANKLGWLVGNLYARIGTQDWPRIELTKMVNNYLSSTDSEPVWIKEYVLKHLRGQKINLNAVTKEDLLEMAGAKIPRNKDIGLDRVIAITREVIPGLEENTYKTLKTHFQNDETLTATFRD
jgi:hypothetical protein